MLSQDLTGTVIELGSDKPFISTSLRMLFPDCDFHTISIDIPFCDYPIIRVDIESERFPFDDNSVDAVIFTEVLEHLFRDPAWTVSEINRVLKKDGLLFLTTPNACGYDVFQNIIQQKNPNERNQFYKCIESGHPHLWTPHECRVLLEAHGFNVDCLTTVNYYGTQPLPGVMEFLTSTSAAPDFHDEVIRVCAIKKQSVAGPMYPEELFPEGVPVQISGALEKWFEVRLNVLQAS